MISSKAKHPNCMYKWMNWIISPTVNAQVAEYFGEAPAQTLACEHTTRQDLLRHLPRARRGLRDQDPLLDHAADAVPGRQRQRLHRLLAVGRPSGSRSRADAFRARPVAPSRATGAAGCRRSSRRSARTRLALLLSAPMLWLVVAYLGAIAASAAVGVLERSDSFTGNVVQNYSTDNFAHVC